MTLRERFDTVFRGGTPDAMAWFGDLTYWYSGHQRLGDLPARWQGPRGIGALHREMRAGEYVPGCRAFTMEEGERVRHTVREEGDLLIAEWETPVGNVRQVQQYAPTSLSHGFLEHAVKSVEDLRVVRFIEEQRRYFPAHDWYDRTVAAYGDFGVAVNAVPASPISELNKAWIGVMDLCYLLVDEPDEVHKTLDLIGERQGEIYRITEESACPYVMICENLSAETMGGYFDRYIRDYLTERVDSLHRHGKYAIIHADGTLRGVVERLPATGVDCIDAVTPRPVGDVGLEELRALVGDEIILLGGLPGAMFAPPFTRADMEQHVREIIRLHKDSGRFMFGVADQVPPNGDINLVGLVSDLIEEYGRY